MKTLAHEIRLLTVRLGASDEQSRIAKRTAQVQLMFREAIEHLYGKYASQVLTHVNAVYIMEDKKAVMKKIAGRKRPLLLVVYMDDSSFRSDVHNQQHYLLQWFQTTYGERLDGFRSYPARNGMRQRHPYETLVRENGTYYAKEVRKALSLTEKKEIQQLCMQIENTHLRKALYRAMVALKSKV